HLGLDAVEPNLHALADHGALEFRECAGYLEEQPAHRCGGVDVLLVQIQIDAGRLKVLDGAKQIDEGPPHAIDGPSHNDVELPTARVVEHGIERRALVAAFGARDALVCIDLYHLPATALCDLPEASGLICDGLGLLVCADPHVDGCALAHDDP